MTRSFSSCSSSSSSSNSSDSKTCSSSKCPREDLSTEITGNKSVDSLDSKSSDIEEDF